MKQLELDFDEAMDKDYSAVVEVEDDKVKVWNNPIIIDNDYCDPYCICPKCGAGTFSIKAEYQHLYFPNLVGKPDESI